MQANQLKAASNKTKKRIGRGGKSGTYSGRGMKGQRSRSGYSQRATFEGGKSTLSAQTKKLRGFKSRNPKNQVVDVELIEKKFKAAEVVNPESLKAKNLISKLSLPVKILAEGDIKKKLSFQDVLLSKSAQKKIKKAGGTF